MCFKATGKSPCTQRKCILYMRQKNCLLPVFEVHTFKKKQSLNLLRHTAKILRPFAPANNQSIGDILLVYMIWLRSESP